MELAACQLYGDKTHVELRAPMSPRTQKDLLRRAQGYFETLRVEGAECELARVSGRGVLNLLPNKAVVVSAELGEFAFQGIVTISRIGDGCVVSQFKQLLADAPFAVNYSVETRRRALIDTLASVHLIEHFFLLEKALDLVWEFVKNDVLVSQPHAEVEEMLLESLSDA